MGNEYEKKYRLDRGRADSLTEWLDELGAERVCTRFEENRIYASESLLSSNSVIRIRRMDDGAELTFKKFVSDPGSMKHHIEFETGIQDPDQMAEILSGLGLELRLVYQKRRSIWKLRGSEVVIDELPFGLFLEIEGEPAAIREAEMLLEADDLEYVPETYPALTERFGRKEGGIVVARF